MISFYAQKYIRVGVKLCICFTISTNKAAYRKLREYNITLVFTEENVTCFYCYCFMVKVWWIFFACCRCMEEG